MTLTLIGDIAISALLIATIGYVAVLNRRLGVLRDDKAQLEELIKALTVASSNAQAGIAGLRQATEEVGQDLQRRLAGGQSLRDDLTYLIERGGSVADRLEGVVRARKEDAPHVAPAARPGAPRQNSSDKVAQLRSVPDEQQPQPAAQISRAERELLRALGGRR